MTGQILMKSHNFKNQRSAAAQKFWKSDMIYYDSKLKWRRFLRILHNDHRSPNTTKFFISIINENKKNCYFFRFFNRFICWITQQNLLFGKFLQSFPLYSRKVLKNVKVIFYAKVLWLKLNFMPLVDEVAWFLKKYLN